MRRLGVLKSPAFDNRLIHYIRHAHGKPLKRRWQDDQPSVAGCGLSRYTALRACLISGLLALVISVDARDAVEAQHALADPELSIRETAADVLVDRWPQAR